jgi:hypothetical protein
VEIHTESGAEIRATESAPSSEEAFARGLKLASQKQKAGARSNSNGRRQLGRDSEWQ